MMNWRQRALYAELCLERERHGVDTAGRALCPGEAEAADLRRMLESERMAKISAQCENDELRRRLRVLNKKLREIRLAVAGSGNVDS